MRILLSFFIFLAAAAAAAAVAAAGPGDLDPVEERAAAEALAQVRTMPRGREREVAAFALAFRLLERDQCQRALRVLNEELIADSDPSDLDSLALSAIEARDLRCMAWVAARVEASARRADLKPDVRAILKVRATTLFNVVGQLDRAVGGKAEVEPSLGYVPEADKRRSVVIDGLAIDIQFSDMPTVGEKLLLDQLDAYRGTPLFRRSLLDLAERAGPQPKLLSSGGWDEIAVLLAEAGEEAAAVELLAKVGNERHFTLDGLRAEVALRAKQYPRAAQLMAKAGYYGHVHQLYTLMREQPMALLPYLADEAAWEGPPNDVLHLASYSEALDRAGEPAAAEAAAREMLARAGRKGRALAPNRSAQMASRLGRLAEARAQLQSPKAGGTGTDPLIIRRGIAVGLALRGDSETLFRFAAESPSRQRIWLLGEVLGKAVGARRDLLTSIAAQLAALLGQEPSAQVTPTWIETLARSGSGGAPLLGIVRNSRDRAKRGALALAAAQGAAGARSDAAPALAEEARRQFGAAIPDRALQELARLYWYSGHGELALQAATLSRAPLARVLALTEIIRPRVEKESRWTP